MNGSQLQVIIEQESRMNWVKESGKWVVKTQHYSPAQFGGVTYHGSKSDFED